MRRFFLDQPSFDSWADRTKRPYHALILVLLLLMIACCTAAILIMGPRLQREGALLWFGTRIDGTVLDTKIDRVGSFKGGEPKYQVRLGYRFVTAEGQQHTGATLRGDVRTPPSFSPGDSVGVYYEAADPANSVADYNLKIDVYALLLFLPFLAVMGIAFPITYLRSWWIWRRRRARG